eukprot:scaffold3829_cov1256-Pavlova_lutheri.AAC.1
MGAPRGTTAAGEVTVCADTSCLYELKWLVDVPVDLNRSTQSLGDDWQAQPCRALALSALFGVLHEAPDAIWFRARLDVANPWGSCVASLYETVGPALLGALRAFAQENASTVAQVLQTHPSNPAMNVGSLDPSASSLGLYGVLDIASTHSIARLHPSAAHSFPDEFRLFPVPR